MTPAYFDNSISLPTTDPVVALRFNPTASASLLATADTFSNYLQRANQDSLLVTPPPQAPAPAATNAPQPATTANTSLSSSQSNSGDPAAAADDATQAAAGPPPDNNRVTPPPDATAANQAAAAQAQTPPLAPLPADSPQNAGPASPANSSGSLSSLAGSKAKWSGKIPAAGRSHAPAGLTGKSNSAQSADASSGGATIPGDVAATEVANINPATTNLAVATVGPSVPQSSAQAASGKTSVSATSAVTDPVTAATGTAVIDVAASSQDPTTAGKSAAGIQASAIDALQAANAAVAKTPSANAAGVAYPAAQAAAAINAASNSIADSSAATKGAASGGSVRGPAKSQISASQYVANSSSPALQNSPEVNSAFIFNQSVEEAAAGTSPALLPAADPGVAAIPVAAGTVNVPNTAIVTTSVVAAASTAVETSVNTNAGTANQAAQGLNLSVTGSLQTQTSARSQTVGQSGGTDNMSAVDRVRFVQRVANAFQAMGNGDGTLSLRLSPPDLGSLKLEVSIQGGVMSARLEAETSQARDLLVDSLPALRERLNDQNIKVDKLDVGLSDQSPGGLPQRSSQDSGYQQNASQFGGRQTGGSAAIGNATVAAAPAPTQIISSDQLNVII